MKNNSYNKENFLDSKNITPSSYRRASKSEQKIGVSIIKKFQKYLVYQLLIKKK